MRLSKAILFFLIGTFVSQCVYYYPTLPAKMASHFNGFGAPDGWMSRESYFAAMSMILALVVFQFTLLPYSIGRMPDRLINMPNKDYWFAEERRAATVETVRHFFEWFSAALLGLFLGINQMVIRANLTGENLSSNTWLILGAFLIFVVFWLIKFVRQFNTIN